MQGASSCDDCDSTANLTFAWDNAALEIISASAG